MLKGMMMKAFCSSFKQKVRK